MSDEPDDENGRVQIHVRRTTHDNRQADIAMTVFCPVRQHSVELDECTGCQYCGGLKIDPRDNSAFLTCRIKDALSPAKAGSGKPLRKPRVLSVEQAASTPIGEIMTKSVVCVDADMSLRALTALFLGRNISGVPVVDEHGKPIGVVTKTDLLRQAFENDGNVTSEPVRFEMHGYTVDLGPGFHLAPGDGAKVRDIMMPMTFTLAESAPVARAAALMAHEGVHRIVVVSPSGTVVGILSALDVLAWLGQLSGYLVWHGDPGEHRSRG
jgi:CBS domain-containing protein